MSRGHIRISIVVFATSLIVGACGGASSAPATSAAASGVVSSPAVPSASTTELVADIDVGGRTMHLYCAGPLDAGEPTVLLEAGLMTPSDAWSGVLSGLREAHRVCAYDRAGLGLSEPAPEASRTTADLVDDLRATLDGAGVDGPFIVVGHSLGAWPAAVFTERYPDDVVGVVLADPRGPRVSAGWREALPEEAAGEPIAVTLNRQELGDFETDPSLNEEALDLTASAAEAVAALEGDGLLFGDRPTVVLRAGQTTASWSDLPADLAATFDTVWEVGQQEFADESSDGSLIVVPDAGHEFAYEQPDALVAALESMLTSLAGR